MGPQHPQPLNILHAKIFALMMVSLSAAEEGIAIMSQFETGEEKESPRVAMSPVPNEQVPIGVVEHEQGLMCRKGATFIGCLGSQAKRGG